MTEEGPGIVPLGKPRRPRMLRLWGIFRVPLFSATFLLMSPAGVGARAKDDFSLVGHHSHRAPSPTHAGCLCRLSPAPPPRDRGC